MRDFSDFDRRLAELGPAPDDVTKLLERALGSDRSRARLDQLLAALVEERGPAAAAAPALDEDTVVERAPAGIGMSGRRDEPGLSFSEPPVERPSDSSWPPPPAPSIEPAPEAPKRHSEATFAALFDLSDRPPPQEPEPAKKYSPAELAAQALVDELLSEPAPASGSLDAAAARRSDIKALLEQDLDPNDFPRSEPPPRPAAAANAEDDFELLVDEDEIVELEDEELEILDD